MKLITKKTDLIKAINKEKKMGFVPTMGNLHKGHESLIKISKKKCKKTIVSIFVNPTQFNNKKDYKNYPKSINKDLKVLEKLKVDFVYLPTIDEVYKNKKTSQIVLKKTDKILCAKYRKGHFEGVLDVMKRFVELISPKMIFMGEKDYQQYFLIKKFIEKKYKTKIQLCKTFRNKNKIALSSRNNLLNKSNLKTLGLITSILFDLKNKINKDKKNSIFLIQLIKHKLISNFNIRIDYIECRNLVNLSNNINNKKFKLFVAYYLNGVRLIDNF